jgi:hypothetical protein
MPVLHATEAGPPLIHPYASLTPGYYVTPGTGGVPHIMMQPLRWSFLGDAAATPVIAPVTKTVKQTRVVTARILSTREVPSVLIMEPEGYQEIEQMTQLRVRGRDFILFFVRHGTGTRSVIAYVLDVIQAAANSTRIDIISVSNQFECLT